MNEKAKPATRLRNLKIKSVSVVDQGANQHAHIRFAKRADEENPDGKPVENDKAFFERIGEAVAKMLHLKRDDEPIEKDAQTFDTIDGSRKMRETIYRVVDALSSSLHSIICDDELTDAQKAEMISTTADQAAARIKSDIAGALKGSTVSKGAEGENGDEGAGEQPSQETPGENAQPEGAAAETPTPDEGINKQEGDKDMKFNLDAMTEEERAQLEDFEKRYGVEETPAHPAAPAAQETPVDNGGDQGEDVYKGLHPAVKAEIESLRKFREEAENAEMMTVAKKYTIIGKKPEELAPVLKSLKAAGGTAYDDMIAVLDGAVQAVEKSGVFGEVGKRGGAGASGDPWEKIEAIAKGFQESDPKLTYADAIDKACIQHPDLVAEYENSRR